MCNVCHKIYVVNVELTVFFAFCINLTEKFNLGIVKILAHFLHHPDVPEEFGTQVSVADYRLPDHT